MIPIITPRIKWVAKKDTLQQNAWKLLEPYLAPVFEPYPPGVTPPPAGPLPPSAEPVTPPSVVPPALQPEAALSGLTLPTPQQAQVDIGSILARLPRPSLPKPVDVVSLLRELQGQVGGETVSPQIEALRAKIEEMLQPEPPQPPSPWLGLLALLGPKGYGLESLASLYGGAAGAQERERALRQSLREEAVKRLYTPQLEELQRQEERLRSLPMQLLPSVLQQRQAENAALAAAENENRNLFLQAELQKAQNDVESARKTIQGVVSNAQARYEQALRLRPEEATKSDYILMGDYLFALQKGLEDAGWTTEASQVKAMLNTVPMMVARAPEVSINQQQRELDEARKQRTEKRDLMRIDILKESLAEHARHNRATEAHARAQVALEQQSLALRKQALAFQKASAARTEQTQREYLRVMDKLTGVASKMESSNMAILDDARNTVRTNLGRLLGRDQLGLPLYKFRMEKGVAYPVDNSDEVDKAAIDAYNNSLRAQASASKAASAAHTNYLKTLIEYEETLKGAQEAKKPAPKPAPGKPAPGKPAHGKAK